MNRMFVVSIWISSCCGCFLPPCGGTDAIVPQRILSSACCITLAGYISRDRHVLGLLGDLIDLIDIDDTVLGTLNVVICRLNNLQEDILYILTDITCLCQRRGICNRKRHI